MNKKILFMLILVILLLFSFRLLFNIKNIASKYENIEIGDYIDYKIEYNNVENKKNNTLVSTYNGWRIIDIQNNKIKIISAGTPCLYDILEGKVEETINDLSNNFENATFELADGSLKKGNYFKNEFAQRVSSLTYKELSHVLCGKNNYDIIRHNNLKDGNPHYTKYTENMKGLISNGSTYLIASRFVEDNTLIMKISGENITGAYSTKYGVRPVIELKEHVNIVSGNGTVENPYQISF